MGLIILALDDAIRDGTILNYGAPVGYTDYWNSNLLSRVFFEIL